MDRRIDRQREHFNLIAERYEQARKHPNHQRLKHLIWNRLFENRLQLPTRSLKVLEPMCGYCDGEGILRAHVPNEFQYSAFDYSDHVVARLQETRPDARIWQQDVGEFHSDEDFDLIILLGGLHHVPHIAGRVVTNLANALRGGGYFINLEPTHGNSVFQFIRERIYRTNDFFDQETERAFGVKELCGFFEAAGLAQASIMFPGLLSYVLYYNPDAFPKLNIGNTKTVDFLWAIDRRFVDTAIGRTLSFATLSLWQKPD